MIWVNSNLNNPTGIALDDSYAYVTNYSNHTIRKIELNNPLNNQEWVNSNLNHPIQLELRWTLVI